MLRIFDLTRGSASSSPTSPSASGGDGTGSSIEGRELAPDTHSDTIKSVLWNADYNIITTADDRNVRWFDLRSRKPIFAFTTKDEIMSCELNALQAMGNGNPGIISVAAGKSCYFFNGGRPGELLKKMDFDQDIASVAINPRTRRVVTGGKNETWAHVWDLETEAELGKLYPMNGSDVHKADRARGSKGTSRPNLVNSILARRESICDGKRRWNDKIVESVQGGIWVMAMIPLGLLLLGRGVSWRHWAANRAVFCQ
jgi:WD40 repeat protein